jgi:hypothetical protein
VSESFAVLGSKFLCKTYIFNFKSALSHSIRCFNIWGISKKKEISELQNKCPIFEKKKKHTKKWDIYFVKNEEKVEVDKKKR